MISVITKSRCDSDGTRRRTARSACTRHSWTRACSGGSVVILACPSKHRRPLVGAVDHDNRKTAELSISSLPMANPNDSSTKILVEDDRTGMHPVVLRRAFTDHVQFSRSRELDSSTPYDRYVALS